jgi:hypothetical protein
MCDDRTVSSTAKLGETTFSVARIDRNQLSVAESVVPIFRIMRRRTAGGPKRPDFRQADDQLWRKCNGMPEYAGHFRSKYL